MLGVFEILPALGQQRLVLRATHLVYGISQVLGHMKLVKGNLLPSPRYPVQRRTDVGRPHIHGNTLNGRLLIIREAIIEARQTRLILAIGDM